MPNANENKEYSYCRGEECEYFEIKQLKNGYGDVVGRYVHCLLSVVGENSDNESGNGLWQIRDGSQNGDLSRSTEEAVSLVLCLHQGVINRVD